MKEYDFTLKFSIPNASDMEQLVERLGSAGCDDALVGTGQTGRLALHFTREAESAIAALKSAIENVREAIPEAKLIEASPDLVGLSDIAELLGFSRQNMRKVMLRQQEVFPPPVHEGNPSIWHLVKVLRAFKERGLYDVDDRLIEVAHTNMTINIARELSDYDQAVAQRLRLA
jgi:hypothetical protein